MKKDEFKCCACDKIHDSKNVVWKAYYPIPEGCEELIDTCGICPSCDHIMELFGIKTVAVWHASKDWMMSEKTSYREAIFKHKLEGKTFWSDGEPVFEEEDELTY